MKTGSRDINGEWVDETTQAKLRNRLSPFWTLSQVINDYPELLNDDEGLSLIKGIAKTCEENKESIINLINETGNVVIVGDMTWDRWGNPLILD